MTSANNNGYSYWGVDTLSTDGRSNKCYPSLNEDEAHDATVMNNMKLRKGGLSHDIQNEFDVSKSYSDMTGVNGMDGGSGGFSSSGSSSDSNNRRHVLKVSSQIQRIFD